jgi:ribosomal protein L11 methyltransferase
MFRWTKEIAPEDEAEWEAKFSLVEIFACFHEQPGRDEVRVEAFMEDGAQAQRLVDLWGGQADEIGDQDWIAVAAREWTGYVLPIRDRFVLTLDDRPEFLDALRASHPGRDLLIFPPGVAFGTGDHATTATCLDLLVVEDMELGLAGKSVLDLGCGTGILGIAAAKLGASRVDGLDNDPLAVAAAQRYWESNGAPGGESVTWSEGDVLEWEPEQGYDLVVGNIFSAILCAAMPQIRRAVAPGGVLILSGILLEQAPGVIDAAESAGLKLDRRVDAGTWTSLRLTGAAES